ncbi:MAG: nucleoside 2-deoxyribosyltransferase [Cyclobacteriaceae bacterium]
MRVFIICSVRGTTKQYRKSLECYAMLLEEEGHSVHLPHRDTDQTQEGIDICTQNMNAIKDADEIHISYNPDSQGTHFDMGVSFALNKKIVIFEIIEHHKSSFRYMLVDWSNRKNG